MYWFGSRVAVLHVRKCVPSFYCFPTLTIKLEFLVLNISIRKRDIYAMSSQNHSTKLVKFTLEKLMYSCTKYRNIRQAINVVLGWDIMYWKLAEDENENHCGNRYSRLLQEKIKKLGTSLMCVIICFKFVEVLCSGIEKEWH